MSFVPEVTFPAGSASYWLQERLWLSLSRGKPVNSSAGLPGSHLAPVFGPVQAIPGLRPLKEGDLMSLQLRFGHVQSFFPPDPFSSLRAQRAPTSSHSHDSDPSSPASMA